jgi:MerR family transcriptional regulator, light-induced transcriptional regulator
MPADVTAVQHIRSAIDTALYEQDRPTAVRTATEAVICGTLGLGELYTQVLSPLLVDTGTAWQRGLTSVWQEHYVSATVRTIVESLYLHVAESAASAPRLEKVIVLACPAEEVHDLGLRMLADRLMLLGWTVHYLGADTPTQEIVAAARELKADVVAISAATHFNRVLLRNVLDQLKEGLPGVRVGVGGPAFSGDTFDQSDLLTETELGLDANQEQDVASSYSGK